MGTWIASEDIKIETGSLDPRSYVGSAYLAQGNELFVITWRGKDEWGSKWEFTTNHLHFKFIRGPQGTVIAWDNQKSLKRYIPSRHVAIAIMVAAKNGKKLYDSDLI